MPITDVPLCLKRGGEEMLLALGADCAEAEGEHRKLADHYFSKAVRVIEDEPEREHDWSSLRAAPLS